MDRLEDDVRDDESASDIVFLLRGGQDTDVKLARQAARLASRFTFAGQPARGISLFAARGDLDARVLLGTRLRTYPRYCQVSGPVLAELLVLLPTFAAPHWTALFRSPGGADRSEATLIADVLGNLGPLLDNPKYMRDPSRRR